MVEKPISRRRCADAGSNSLDIARDTFTLLVTGPNPASLNGRLFPGLPDRLMPLDEVRDRLLARRCPQETRDAVWARLVLRARTEGATATVVAVGMALPALTSVAATLSRRFLSDPTDLCHEILAGFLAALPTVDLRRPRVMLRLRWAAYRSGHKALTDALAGPTPVAPGFRSSPPDTPWGHPDLVLARAVADGVLTQTEAELIGATRLEDVPVADWAAQQRTGEWATYKARSRAERRLVEYLREAIAATDPDDPLTEQVAALITLSCPVDPAPGLPRKSLSVSVAEVVAAKEIRARMSKRQPKPGVQGCGVHPRSARVPEVPKCA